MGKVVIDSNVTLIVLVMLNRPGFSSALFVFNVISEFNVKLSEVRIVRVTVRLK